jgi:hypothetical protein
MASTRSSNYAAIGGCGNGLNGRSQLSRRLARGLPPGGKEEEDNGSTPVAFDVDDSNGGKVEVNGECEGDGNSDGPVEKNNDSHCNVDNDDNNGSNGGGGRTEVQTLDDCGGAGGDGGRGGEGGGG